MLVLSRKVGERILIGKDIAVTVVRISPASVRVGIEAPPELDIVREELRREGPEAGTPVEGREVPLTSR